MKKSFVVASLMFAAFSAQASQYYDEPEYYGAIGTGKASISVNAAGASAIPTVSTGPISVLFGAKMNDRIGWEVTYGSGSAVDNAAGLTVDTSQITLMGTLTKWLNEDVELIGKVGYGTGSTTLTPSTVTPTLQPSSASASGLAYGVAAEYHMDDYMGIRVSWTRTKGAVATSGATPQTFTGEVTDTSIWLTYRF